MDHLIDLACGFAAGIFSCLIVWSLLMPDPIAESRAKPNSEAYIAKPDCNEHPMFYLKGTVYDCDAPAEYYRSGPK